ncbi:hypothetical protein THAOC_29941, partial [Thalassiosira oceanica]
MRRGEEPQGPPGLFLSIVSANGVSAHGPARAVCGDPDQPPKPDVEQESNKTAGRPVPSPLAAAFDPLSVLKAETEGREFNTHGALKRRAACDIEAGLAQAHAELGFIEALAMLGILHGTGNGVQQDKKKAVYFYEKAAMQGHFQCRHNIGSYEGMAGNHDRAVRHFLISAKLGFEDSVEMIKQMFTNGLATKDQYSQAVKDYQIAVEGMKSTQREEAKKFEYATWTSLSDYWRRKGNRTAVGTAEGYAGVAELWTEAAELGLIEAAYFRGDRVFNGTGQWLTSSTKRRPCKTAPTTSVPVIDPLTSSLASRSRSKYLSRLDPSSASAGTSPSLVAARTESATESASCAPLATSRSPSLGSPAAWGGGGGQQHVDHLVEPSRPRQAALRDERGQVSRQIAHAVVAATVASIERTSQQQTSTQLQPSTRRAVPCR